MQIIDMPSPNYWTDKHRIKAVVLHGTAGPLQASLDWLRNPQPGNPDAAVSANFVIAKSGQVYRLVDFTKGLRAWANGEIETPDQSLNWLMEAIRQGINPNRLTVSLEHEATKREMESRARMPDKQFNSSIDLTAMILTISGLKANHETVITHSQISGKIKYNCPGVIFAPAYTEVLIQRHPYLA